MKALVIALLFSSVASAATVLPGSYYDSSLASFGITTDTGLSAGMLLDTTSLAIGFLGDGSAINVSLNGSGGNADHNGVPPDFMAGTWASLSYWFEGDPIPIPWDVYEVGTISFIELSGPFTFTGWLINATDYWFNGGAYPLVEFTGSGTAYFRIRVEQYSVSVREATVEMGRYEFEAVPEPDIAPTPEPGTWLLMVTGFAALAWRRRRCARRGPSPC